MTYDHRWKICDLFAVNGSGSPYFLVDYKGRDYFEWVYILADPITLITDHLSPDQLFGSPSPDGQSAEGTEQSGGNGGQQSQHQQQQQRRGGEQFGGAKGCGRATATVSVSMQVAERQNCPKRSFGRSGDLLDLNPCFL